MEEQIELSDDLNEVLQTLKKVNINIEVPPEASRSDKGLYNLLLQGTNENDYKKVYHFVCSVEMGCGFRSSETAKLHKMYHAAIEEDEGAVIEILNAKSKVIDIVYHCYCIEKEYKLQLLQSPKLTNGSVIFELIKQLVDQIQVKELNSSSDYRLLIGNGIIKLAMTDINLFQYFIEKFQYKEQFYYVIAVALSDMASDHRRVYAKSINLNSKDSNHYDYVRILLENVKTDKYDSFITDIKEIIYTRWNGYLEGLLESREFIPDIIINSYADLVLNCFCKRYQDEELFLIDLNQVVTQFNKEIYKWYEKGTEFSSMYYIYATKLFFLKKVQEVNGISLSSRKNIVNKVRSLFDNSPMLHYKYIKVEDIVLCLD